MKRKLIVIVSLALCILTAASNGAYAFKEQDMTVTEVWSRTDIILNSEKKYKNPYLDVDIDAEFVHEDGTVIKLFGFWNGGSEWRVRFSPTKTGVWNYKITCSDTENADLHNRTGSITAVRNTGNTDIDRHGFVKISDNGRYFVHDDGTPFYWLGDTNWQAPNYVSVTKCNYPGCECGNQFFHEVNDRVDKGFTVYQTYFDGAESDGGGQRDVSGEPSLWTVKYSKINAKTFSTKIDRMFDYLAAKGMVIALGFGVHSSTVKSMDQDSLDRLSRYLTARYAAYPVIWITAQEITGPEHFNAWVSSARIVDEGDGYDHPQTAHQYPLEVSDEYVRKLDKESWHDFYALQNGHGPTIPKKSTYQGYWKNSRSDKGAKPFIETEANYEDIYCGGFNGYSASRVAAWKANLCGSYGFTYGATGIWANCWSTSGSTGWMGTFSTEPWYMGLDKPGSYEMKYLAKFFKYVDFSKLVPRFSSKTYSDFSDESKVVSSSEDNKTYVAYFCNSNLTTGTLKGLNENEKYSAKWYDVLTGKFVLISDDIDHTGGVYKIPEKPDTSDWALLVTSRTDLGEYETEPKREYAAASEVNVLEKAKASASSSSGGSSADKAIDGKDSTWWCASSGNNPQWISFDMGSARKFNTFSLEMYPGTNNMTYSVFVSDDGETWTEIKSYSNKSPRTASESLFVENLDKEYECRYIKFVFKEVIGNWAAVVEAKAYTDAQTDRPVIKGIIQDPGVECVGGYVYSSYGKGSDTVSNLTDGDISTEWKPFASESTQTVIMDMYGSKNLGGIEIVSGKDAETPDYRIEGSADRESWTVLVDSSVSGKSIFIDNGRTVVAETLDGNYRYVKLILMGGSGKKVIKTVSEIRLYADTKTGSAPEKADRTGLKKLYSKYKSVRNSSGEYSAGAYREFLIALGDAAKILSRSYVTALQAENAENALQKAYERLTEPSNEIPATEEAAQTVTDAGTGNKPAETKGTDNKGGGKNNGAAVPIIIASASAAAVGGAAAAGLAIKRRKKREHNEKSK